MKARLRPVNALVGLCTPGDVNPAALADAGFRLAALEVRAACEAGAVTVDGVLLHEETAHLLLCEAKSGANIEADQAIKYAALDALTVVQAASVTLRRRVRPTAEVVYVCMGEYLDRIRTGLTRIDVACPIVAVHEWSITLENRESASDLLKAAFPQPVVLAAPLTRLIAFDHESSVEEILPVVRAQLVAALSRRVGQITCRALTEQAAPHYALYGKSAQTKLRQKVAEAARRIAKEDATGTYRYEPPTRTRDEAVVRMLRTPEQYDTRGRTQGYQALARRQGARRAARPRVDPGQLDLLRELDMVDDGGDRDDAHGQDDQDAGGEGAGR